MNFEQKVSSGDISRKSLENKNSLDIYYGIISKKVLDTIKFSEDLTWKDKDGKSDSVILKKVEEKLSDPDFKTKVKKAWNDSTSYIDFEDVTQEPKIVKGVITRLKEEVFYQ